MYDVGLRMFGSICMVLGLDRRSTRILSDEELPPIYLRNIKYAEEVPFEGLLLVVLFVCAQMQVHLIVERLLLAFCRDSFESSLGNETVSVGILVVY